MVDMKKKATDILEDYSNSYSQVDLEILTKFLEQIKSEAIKDFEHLVIDRSRNGVIYASDIPDLVKEMTEQANFEKIEHNSLCETETYKGSE